MDYTKRIKKLQKNLKKKGLDALLITQPENRRYLSGYTGADHGIGETAGVLVVPAKGQVRLLTDFRYKIQAQQDSPSCEVLIYTKGVLALLKELLPQMKVQKLGFESDYVLHNFEKKLQGELKDIGIRLTATEGIVAKLRLIKDEDEIALLRKSVLLNEKVFQDVHKHIQAGMTEVEVAIMMESTMRRYGAEAPSFDTIVACGANGALPHAVPGLTPLKKKKSITIDMGLILDGYCSDMTRTFVLGKPTKKYLQYHRLVRKAQLAGMDAVRAGATGAEVDGAARKIIADAGYGKYFGHALGHGVGLAVHEGPRVSGMSDNKLKEGMIITIEPGIYIPGWGGIRLENMVVVRKGGCENLNTDTYFLDI